MPKKKHAQRKGASTCDVSESQLESLLLMGMEKGAGGDIIRQIQGRQAQAHKFQPCTCNPGQ